MQFLPAESPLLREAGGEGERAEFIGAAGVGSCQALRRLDAEGRCPQHTIGRRDGSDVLEGKSPPQRDPPDAGNPASYTMKSFTYFYSGAYGAMRSI